MKKTLIIFFFVIISYSSFSQFYIKSSIHQSNSIAIDNVYSSWDWGGEIEYQLNDKAFSVGFWPLVRNIDNRKDPVALFQVPFMYNSSKTAYCEGLRSRKINFGAGVYMSFPFMETGLNQAVFYGLANEISLSFYFSDNLEVSIGLLSNFDLGLGRYESGVFMRFGMPTKDYWKKAKVYMKL